MINNLILVGRVVEDPKLVTLEAGYKVANFVLAVQRPFRNENNEYETDFIPIQTWMGIAEMICEYVGKGSIIGLKCRLSTHIVDVNEVKLKSIDVIGERVSFIKLNPPESKVNCKDLKNLDNESFENLDDEFLSNNAKTVNDK